MVKYVLNDDDDEAITHNNNDYWNAFYRKYENLYSLSLSSLSLPLALFLSQFYENKKTETTFDFWAWDSIDNPGPTVVYYTSLAPFLLTPFI